MGLDMFVHTRKEHIEAPAEFETFADDERLYHWKNHYALNAWMLYWFTERGGDGDWNNQTLRLDNDILEALQVALDNGELAQIPEFGADAAEYIEQDAEFIECAKAALSEGRSLYYINWW